MKCARLNLQERCKKKPELPVLVSDKPRRYCQKRMVNPEHEEDPRWMDLWDRFHCNMHCDQIREALESARSQEQDTEELVLTVQTLKFEGDVDKTKRQRNSFKYKTNTDGNKHRMFVKEAVTENEYSDDDRSSQLTCYYFDDYIKYLYNSDRSRPASSKSSIFQKRVNNNMKENKATQVEIPQINERKKTRTIEPKVKTLPKIFYKQDLKEDVKDISETITNTKIAYQKTGKRKSLTISRAQSPETVQVIRVDVVCNYPSSSILSNYEETKDFGASPSRSISKLEELNLKHSLYANKYLLTKSIKTLDENLSGGSKVTLLCKTFKLTDRLSNSCGKSNAGKDRRDTRAFKDVTKLDNTLKKLK